MDRAGRGYLNAGVGRSVARATAWLGMGPEARFIGLFCGEPEGERWGRMVSGG